MNEGNRGINIESREVPKGHVYEVRIDQNKLAQIEGVPEVMRSWLNQLPDRLVFNEQITLIVGENGAGKTTLAKAILEARARQAQENYPGARHEKLLLSKGDLATALAPAIVVVEQRNDPNFKSQMIEGPEVMSEIRRWANEQHTQADYAGGEVNTGPYSHKLSNRQLFEQAIQGLKDIRIDGRRDWIANIEIVFDEPEQGLSPQRQMELPNALPGYVQEGDTMLVPTNNLALFLSDMPRVDLDQPERGVFRPSDFEESGKIEFHGKQGTGDDLK